MCDVLCCGYWLSSAMDGNHEPDRKLLFSSKVYKIIYTVDTDQNQWMVKILPHYYPRLLILCMEQRATTWTNLLPLLHLCLSLISALLHSGKGTAGARALAAWACYTCEGLVSLGRLGGERVNSVTLPEGLNWLGIPVILWASMTAAFQTIVWEDKTRQPSIPQPHMTLSLV